MRKFPIMALSTEHVTPEAASWLNQRDCPIPSYPKKMSSEFYGWFVFAEPDLLDEEEIATFPQCIQDCIRFAWQNGCDCIMFDSDEEPVPALTTYPPPWWCLGQE